MGRVEAFLQAINFAFERRDHPVAVAVPAVAEYYRSWKWSPTGLKAPEQRGLLQNLSLRTEINTLS
jgi:hypothetical protein